MKLNRKLLRKMILKEISMLNETVSTVMGSTTSELLNKVPFETFQLLREKINNSPAKKVLNKYMEWTLQDPDGYGRNEGKPTPYTANHFDTTLKVDEDKEEGVYGSEGLIKLPSSLNDGSNEYMACQNEGHANWLKVHYSPFINLILIDDETANLFKEISEMIRM